MTNFDALKKITYINDRFIEDAALPPVYTSREERTESAAYHFFHSGWWTAILCAVVSLTVLFGIIIAGRQGDIFVTPAGTETDSEEGTVSQSDSQTDMDTSAITVTDTIPPEAETLRENKEPLPEAWPKETVEATVYQAEPTGNSSAKNVACTITLTYTELLQGDRLAVDIAMTINGEAYTAYTAYLRYYGETATGIDIPVTNYADIYLYADIPSDATCGTYDLVVKAEAIGYEGVLAQAITVGARENTAFSFAYALDKNTYSLTEFSGFSNIWIDLAVINEGDPWILYDNDYVYNVSEAYLTKTENGVTVTYPLFCFTHEAIMWEVQYIDHGEPSVQNFFVEAPNMEPGVYDLVVSYGGSLQIFENVLRIIE